MAVGRRLLSVVAPLGLVLSIVSAGGLLAATRSLSCTAGVHTVGGATVRSFCGPAHATAKVGRKTFRFSGGQCAVSNGYFTVNIGSITLGQGVKPKFAYLGIDVRPSADGVHHNQVVSWQVPGKGYAVLGATVTVSGGMKRGSFTGNAISGGTATGSFTC